MKKKFFVGFFITILVSFMLFGCSSKQPDPKLEKKETGKTVKKDKNEKKDSKTGNLETLFGGLFSKNKPDDADQKKRVEEYLKIYSDVLDRFYYLIDLKEYDEELYLEGEMGVMEAVGDFEGKEALSQIGYVVRDISSDGIPELIIASMDKQDQGKGNPIHVIYTVEDGKPRLFLEGSEGNRFFLTKDDQLFYSGFFRSIYSIFGLYEVSKDCSELICKDYYFTYEKDPAFEEIGFYHNTSGDLDNTVSKELDIDLDEFEKIRNEYADTLIKLDLKPFSDYEPVVKKEKIAAEEMPLEIYNAEDILSPYDEYDEFSADDSENRIKVALITKKEIKDLKVVLISIEDISDDGTSTYSMKELYRLDKFLPQRPFVLDISFIGSMTFYGVSFVDEAGKTRVFGIYESGMDGSLQFLEM